MSCLSTDPKHVHNSSTDIVDNIYNCLCPYKRKQNDYQHCLQITFYETFHGRKSVQRNLTCNTSERKTRDFYTILSGCPQNWPIYPLYFSFDQLFIDLVLFFSSTKWLLGRSTFQLPLLNKMNMGKGKVEKKENLSSTFVENRVW